MALPHGRCERGRLRTEGKDYPVAVAPLTRTVAWGAAPGNVRCRPKATGLTHAAGANVSQLTVVDRRRLVERVGELPPTLLRELDEGMKVILGLS